MREEVTLASSKWPTGNQAGEPWRVCACNTCLMMLAHYESLVAFSSLFVPSNLYLGASHICEN